MPSPGLQALLEFSKSDDADFSWQGAAKALAPVYSEHMTLVDVVEVLLTLHAEAMAEPRFEMGHVETARRALLLAPLKGLHSVEMFGPKGLDTAYTVEQFYNSFVSFIMCNMRLARVDWLMSKERQPFLPSPAA